MMNITEVIADIIIFIILLPVIAIFILDANISGTTFVVMGLIDIILVVAFTIHLMKKTGLKKEDR